MDHERDEDAGRAELDRLRAAVLTDAAVCAALAELWSPEAFAARLAEVAQARGVRLGAGQIAALLRQSPSLPLVVGAVPAGWLPADVIADVDPPAIRWAHFSARRLVDPFYNDSLRRVVSLPFNRLFGFRTPLADLTAPPGSLAPSGLIFHMSRCGSTLVAQMLAASDANIVVAEAPPIDAVVRLDRGATGLDAAGHAVLLRAMTLAFSQRRGAGERRAFVKLDSWHIRAAPLFRAAFPGTPWVFLYRDPTEVMVSQMRRRGMQTLPDRVPPALLGLDEPVDAPLEDYVAGVLAAICAAAASAHQAAGVLLVNYDELPRALAGRILPHFGVAASPEEIAVMEAAAGRDAKDPQRVFAPDSAAATPAIRAAVQRHLAGVYARLETARSGA
jgi:hypothetical protein